MDIVSIRQGSLSLGQGILLWQRVVDMYPVVCAFPVITAMVGQKIMYVL